MSLRCPGVPIRRSGLPSASAAAWILVLSPPRDRPRPWASAPLFPCARQRHADAPARWSNRSSAIPDRLRAKEPPARHRERPSQSSDSNAVSPIDVAQPLRQITPAAARTGHPQQRIQKPTVVGTRPALTLGAARHEAPNSFPLVIPKCIAIHRRSPKISVESDLPSLGNPKSLNRHYGLGYGRCLF